MTEGHPGFFLYLPGSSRQKAFEVYTTVRTMWNRQLFLSETLFAFWGEKIVRAYVTIIP
jgi:hypothetical protein